jgi:RecA/RadA recombinase
MSQQNVLSLADRKTGDRQKALDAALGQIERAFGKGSIMRLGQGEQIADVETVSTGSLGLDIALGIGGLPRGRVVEIYGPESSGKTTLALHVLAEAQGAGGPDPHQARQEQGDGQGEERAGAGRGPASIALTRALRPRDAVDLIIDVPVWGAGGDGYRSRDAITGLPPETGGCAAAVVTHKRNGTVIHSSPSILCVRRCGLGSTARRISSARIGRSPHDGSVCDPALCRSMRWGGFRRHHVP